MRMQGVVIGLVTDVNDPAGEGRLKLRFPWMPDEVQSDWAPVAAPMAGPSRGAFLMPEVDDEVLVGFEHGDFDHPFILGFLWNGSDKPPETDTQNRVILTPGGHTLRFEDADPKKLIVRSSSGHEALLDDTSGAAKIRLQSAGGLKITMDDTQQSIELNGGGRILALKAGQVQIT